MSPEAINDVVFNLAACAALLGLGLYTVWEALRQRYLRKRWSLGLIGALVLGGVMSAAMVGYALLFLTVLSASMES